MATLSLEEVLSKYDLKRKDLEAVCPRDVRNKVAVELIDWKMIGYCFDFSRAKLEAIDRENQTEDQRKVALLDSWGERDGREATYFRLAEVLRERGRGDLIELLCGVLTKNRILTTDAEETIEDSPRIAHRDRDTAERIKMLETEFDSLHQQLVSELTEKNICSRDELLRVVSMLPIDVKNEYESLIQQKIRVFLGSKTIFEVLLHLSPLFTFIDYGLLDHLVFKFGSLKLRNDMKMYVSKIQVFMRETTVGDLIDYWPGGEELHAQNYSKLKIKFHDDPKTYTLERLNEFRRRFCSKLRLSDFIFGLIRIEAGESFFVTWLVPVVMSSELAKMISEIEENFYQMEHVIMILLNQTILYKVAPVPEITFTEADAEVEERLSLGNGKEQEVSDISSKLQKEMLRLRTTMSEKDLENQRLLCVVEEAEMVHRPLIQSYAARISEKISGFMKFMQVGSNDSSNDELEQMKNEIQDLIIGLKLAAKQIGRKETLNESEIQDLTIDLELAAERNLVGRRETMTTLNERAKRRQVEEWLSSSIPVPPPSDSGLVTEATCSVRSIDSECSDIDINDPIRYNELEVEPDKQDSKT